MKILAVDDDNAVRISLNVMFRKWNDIELDVAEDANNALEKLAITFQFLYNMPPFSGSRGDGLGEI